MTRRHRLIAAGILSIGALVAIAAVRQGGCGREPPDEPAPAADCKPGDNTCNAGAPATPPSPPAGGAA